MRPTEAPPCGCGYLCCGYVAIATAPSMELLVAGRAITGLGSGLDGVALYVAIARVFPTHIRPKMFGALAMAWLLPSVVGPALSGVVTEHFGWRWVFGTVPVLAIVAMALLLRGSRGTSMNQAVDPESLANVTKAAAPRLWMKPLWGLIAALSVLMMSDAGTRTQPWWPAQLGIAVVLLAIAVNILLPKGTWRATRGLPALILMRGLMGTGFTIADVYLPLFMIEQRHLPVWLAGLSLTVGGVTWAVGAWLSARGTLHPRQCLRWGALLMTLGLMISALVLFPGWPVWIAWLGWAAAGFGIGMAYPTQSVVVLEQSSPSEQGSNASALQLSETLMTATALGIVGAVFAALLTAGESAYVMAFGVAAALSVGTLLVARRAAS
ncbi:MFS transporter [Arthrobacter psychrolactophilus]